MIRSKDNPAIKQLKRWLEKPKRSDSTMVLEGIHLTQALFETGAAPERMWVAESAVNHPEIKALLHLAQRLHTRVDLLSDPIFRSLSTLAQGESMLCEISKPVAKDDLTENAVLLDGIQDAGNLGSILRSAAAAGIKHIYLNDSCVNPFSPKTLRAAVGAHFSLEIHDGVDLQQVMIDLQRNQVQVLATSLQAQNSIYQCDLTRKTAWLMGSEGSGVDEVLLAAASTQVIIPMTSGESLNVAAAATVCLFEMVRQHNEK